jgi:hypothetical protein
MKKLLVLFVALCLLTAEGLGTMDIKGGSYIENNASNDTYYTALDTITTDGKLFMVGAALDTGNATYQWYTGTSLPQGVTIKITIDGTATEYKYTLYATLEAPYATVDSLAVDGGGNRHRFGFMVVQAAFATSLKIEVKQNTGTAQDLRVFWKYGENQ